MKFSIDPKIFDKWPEVKIGILVLEGITNKDQKDDLMSLLRDEEEKQKKDLAGKELGSLPEVAVWREVYRAFGSNPHDYKSSVEALLKRVQLGKPLPQINKLVDLYNFLSIKYHIPAGAEDLDKVKGDINLTFSDGTDKGKYLGSDTVETCDKGEVAYKDEVGFICRRWNWREADRTKIDEDTQNAVLVLENAAGELHKNLEEALNETEELMKKYLGGKVERFILSKDNLALETDFKTGSKAVEEKYETDKEKDGFWASQNDEKSVQQVKKKIKKKLLPKDSLAFILIEMIHTAVTSLYHDVHIQLEDISVEHPEEESHGDYSANIAMKLTKELHKSPMEIANEIVKNIPSSPLIEKMEVAKPGFINLWLSKVYLSRQVEEVIRKSETYGSVELLKGKKILLEHTSPNPQTTIMLGHLRNNFLGMAMANILSFLGAKVTRDCIVNDRGVHICRSILGYLIFGRKNSDFSHKDLLNFKNMTDEQAQKASASVSWRLLLSDWVKDKSRWLIPQDLGLKPDHANLIWYVLGSKAYSLSENVHNQVGEILQAWEKEEGDVWEIWKQLLDWSKQGYTDTYKRVGSVHDWVWYESQLYKGGKELVNLGLKKGVFQKSKGAIVTNLAAHSLPDAVVIKSDGTATYFVFDLNLTLQKMKKFPGDLYIWDIGAEQTLYFKQLFALCEGLGFGRREKFFHLSYALINFKGGGKMATRKGNVVMADEILDQLHKKALDIMKSSNQELRGKLSQEELDSLAETVGVGAIKYSLLKFSRDTTVFFDINESLSMEGDSGSYLQYTFARCESVLNKIKNQKSKIKNKYQNSKLDFNSEEMAVLRMIYKFPEVILVAGEKLAPNLICSFLFDLARKYNNFYNKHSILKADNEASRNFRLALTYATATVLKNGLGLLGIEAPAKM